MFYKKDSKLYYTYDNELVCVEAWGGHLWHMV